jgi:hypothetical protein
MAKNNYVKIVSSEGISKYAWLTQPDTKFDKDGHYKVNLVVSAETAQPLIKQIDDEMKKSLELAKEKNKGKAIKQANLPYENEVVEGKETGNIEFKFKRKAQIIASDGKVIPFKVAIFDSAGKPLIDTNVWSGSKMKVSAELMPWYTAMAGAGVSLRLRAVQITELVEGGAGSAEGYGFDKVDGGFVAAETEIKNEVAAEKVVQEETDF